MSGKSRSSLVAGLMAMALGAAACGAGDDTVGIAESEVGDATSTSGATGDGSEQYAPEPAGDVTGEPVDGAADTGGDTGEALDLSAPVQLQGDIAIPLDSDELVIDATAGQRISVDVTALSGGCAESSIWDLNIGLYDADGAPVGSTGYVGIYGCQPYGPWEMPTDGRYTLSFSGGNGKPSTGAYQASIATLGG